MEPNTQQDSRLVIRLDSTALGRSNCIRNLHNHVVEGYTQKAMKASMLYGVAIHKFIQVMYDTAGDYPKAVIAAKKVFMEIPVVSPGPKSLWQRDIRHMLTVCELVWSMSIQEDKNFSVIMLGDKAATEQTFDLPYWEDETVVVRLQGTIDSVGKFHNGVYAIRDFKTTSGWDTKGYFEQYTMSRQLRIYTIACKIMAVKYPESILGKVGASRMGAFIDAIFLKPNPNDTTFGRSDVFSYSDEQLNEFRLTLDDTCKRLSMAVKTGYIPKEGIFNGTCEAKWGKCDFWNCCGANANVEQVLLARDFNKKPFLPLQYNE